MALSRAARQEGRVFQPTQVNQLRRSVGIARGGSGTAGNGQWDCLLRLPALKAALQKATCTCSLSCEKGIPPTTQPPTHLLMVEKVDAGLDLLCPMEDLP